MASHPQVASKDHLTTRRGLYLVDGYPSLAREPLLLPRCRSELGLIPRNLFWRRRERAMFVEAACRELKDFWPFAEWAERGSAELWRDIGGGGKVTRRSRKSQC